MTGLEKILKAIEDEAKAAADAVIAKANGEAEELLAAAKSEAEKKVSQIAVKSEADVKAALDRAESAAALQERKMILDAKQQIISNIISKAKSALVQLPDSEYFDIILNMIKLHAHKKPGKILFSSSDKARLPKDFDDRLKQALADKKGATLTVSDQNAVNGGGFLLIYGDIEENCTFDALFGTAMENLLDKVNSLLFS